MRFWFIMRLAAKAPRRRRPVSSTLGRANARMPTAPRYSQAEIERRWLVPAASGFHGTPTRERWIEDHYLVGTRLRLRKVSEMHQPTIYKLGKKYEPEAEGAHQVVTIYLSEDEYKVLACLPAQLARKRRLSVCGGSLDIYEFPNIAAQVFEVEFRTPEEAIAYAPPRGVGQEITNDPRYSGYALASAA
jgi:CYTH domain-containing protein